MVKRTTKKKPVKTTSRKIDNQAGQGLSGFFRSLASEAGCVTGRTSSAGSWSTGPSRDPTVVTKQFKTKAASITEIIRLRIAFDDLVRTHQTEREKLVDGHNRKIKELEHSNMTFIAGQLDSQNKRLLDILETGSKGESFPRRG